MVVKETAHEMNVRSDGIDLPLMLDGQRVGFRDFNRNRGGKRVRDIINRPDGIVLLYLTHRICCFSIEERVDL